MYNFVKIKLTKGELLITYWNSQVLQSVSDINVRQIYLFTRVNDKYPNLMSPYVVGPEHNVLNLW